MFDKYSRIMVVAAHPDDEVLGCGGMMAQLRAELPEAQVRVVFMTHGELVRVGASDGDLAATIQPIAEREHAAKKANEILGVDDLVFLRYPDQRLDSFMVLELAQRLEGLMEVFQPSHLFVNHPGDLNQDHVATSQAAMIAARPGIGTIDNVLMYPVLSSTGWAFGTTQPVFSPNVAVDITSTFEKKKAALREYGAEMREYPHPRSIRAVEAQATTFGALFGIEYVEAFHLIRTVAL